MSSMMPESDILRLPILYNSEKQKRWKIWGDLVMLALLLLFALLQMGPLLSALRSPHKSELIFFCVGIALFVGHLLWASRSRKPSAPQVLSALV